jgi:hydrogenase nickel incorporation protein HypA/HybF
VICQRVFGISRLAPSLGVFPTTRGFVMHELSIALGLVEVACEALAGCDPPPNRVQSVLVRIGALSGVVSEALEFCYGLSVAGTPLEGSRLVVQEQPVVLFCPRCQENRTLDDDLGFRCPVCNTLTSQIVHGRELELVSMELIDDESTPEPVHDTKACSPDSGGPTGAAQGQ